VGGSAAVQVDAGAETHQIYVTMEKLIDQLDELTEKHVSDGGDPEDLAKVFGEAFPK
jgi:fructose-bisphosphate aldolase class 1